MINGRSSASDRTTICGQRYQHQVERQASRAGTVPSEVVLGGPQGGASSAARARQRRGSAVAQDPGESAQPGRRPLAALRLAAQRPGEDAKDRRMAGDGARKSRVMLTQRSEAEW